ncbi:MAG: hypothetical protein JXR37_29575 [Kiritimatiellae bacterium]|nr:hypothetical protein [Kiritimatiellia bacterium]
MPNLPIAPAAPEPSVCGRELAFTRIFEAAKDKHPYRREIECLQYQVPATLMPIRDGDWFAGRLNRMQVGILPEHGPLTDAAYYCTFKRVSRLLADAKVSESEKKDVQYLLDFWRDKTTYALCRRAYPPHVSSGIPSDDYYSAKDMAYPMYGLGGPCLDFGKLVRLGIGGLRREVAEQQARNAAGADETQTCFYESLLLALDLFASVARRYAKEAGQKADSAADPAARARLLRMAESLSHIAEEPPASFHAGIQLVWLYALAACVKNFGRLDVTLGDLLARDLATGALTEDQAREMLTGLWRLIIDLGENYNSRILVGGKGRPNEANADRFAMLCLAAQAELRDKVPQLSLRCHAGMNTALWDKALDVIGSGSTFPILYNDDALIPGVAEAFDVPVEEAEQYMMYGCGEFVLEHMSIGSPDAALNVAKVLNTAMHNGRDPLSGEPRGLALGSLDTFESFERFQKAFARQMEHQAAMLGEVQDTIHRVTGQQAAFPFLSLLYDDCIARGKALLAGGVRYAGGTMETFGNTTAADSLLAVKKLVFENKTLSPHRLLAALDADFDGYADVQSMLRAVPKFGNDEPEADAMAEWVNESLCESCRRQKDFTLLHSFLAVLVNNGDHVTLGKGTAATADGRKAGAPLSNGNQPTAGNDISGITALLNSMARLKASIHAGATQNLKFSRATFNRQRAKVSALLRTYFKLGGTQAMITTTDRDELERAMTHPQEYLNLIVRVGGFSERFVNLSQELQQDIIRRTLY